MESQQVLISLFGADQRLLAFFYLGGSALSMSSAEEEKKRKLSGSLGKKHPLSGGEIENLVEEPEMSSAEEEKKRKLSGSLGKKHPLSGGEIENLAEGRGNEFRRGGEKEKAKRKPR